ncbi:hypothetical protein EK21DRAFT_68299 [Setomelanomma holmii]|uniref:Tyrosine specific protein phosphatases domain-containing protein n=1 Tax=Setomelanomma holmii TaxID=210430 RepID=A0A9P4H8S6_9PLEO|nr:hypothetical protein EK21DRAFT_68299 [Setomelanomma holmii]
MSSSTSESKPDLPYPPFYIIPNISNLRDAALHPLTTPTGPIRAGLLFRSADVSKLTLPDWTALRELGIGHVFDLRSAPEVEKSWAPDSTPEWVRDMTAAGVQRSWVPVFQEADYSPQGIAKRYVKYMDEDVAGFVEAYRDMLHAGPGAYATIFKYLASPTLLQFPLSEKAGALIHCSAGKDRTGIFFALLFTYLGVPATDIAAEYHRTELGLSDIRNSIVDRLLQSPAFKNYIAAQSKGRKLKQAELAKIVQDANEGKGFEEGEVSPEMMAKGRAAALRMVGAKEESMLRTLGMVEEEFGGAEKYMREKCGLTDDEMEGLKRNLVVRE